MPPKSNEGWVEEFRKKKELAKQKLKAMSVINGSIVDAEFISEDWLRTLLIEKDQEKKEYVEYIKKLHREQTILDIDRVRKEGEEAVAEALPKEGTTLATVTKWIKKFPRETILTVVSSDTGLVITKTPPTN